MEEERTSSLHRLAETIDNTAAVLKNKHPNQEEVEHLVQEMREATKTVRLSCDATEGELYSLFQALLKVQIFQVHFLSISSGMHWWTVLAASVI